MIGSRKPIGVVSQHAMVARQHIHGRKRRCGSKVCARRYVGWRHTDDEWRACRIRSRMKVAVLLPKRVEARFNGLGIVVFWEFHGCASVPRRRHGCLSATTSLEGVNLGTNGYAARAINLRTSEGGIPRVPKPDLPQAGMSFFCSC